MIFFLQAELTPLNRWNSLHLFGSPLPAEGEGEGRLRQLTCPAKEPLTFVLSPLPRGEATETLVLFSPQTFQFPAGL
jgi:hypothetical protein